MLQLDTFVPDVVRNHISDWNKFMSIRDRTVDRSLSDDGFHKMVVPYNTASYDN